MIFSTDTLIQIQNKQNKELKNYDKEPIHQDQKTVANLYASNHLATK